MERQELFEVNERECERDRRKTRISSHDTLLLNVNLSRNPYDYE